MATINDRDIAAGASTQLQNKDLYDIEKKLSGEKIEIDIAGPLTFWILMLAIGLIIQLLLINLLTNVNNPGIKNLLPELAGWILYMPGAIIFPLVVALWVGERVGASGNKFKSAIAVGGINGFYAALIYAIAIFIVYLLLKYIDPAFLAFEAQNETTYLEYDLVVPIVIVVFLVPIISGLSAARHSISAKA